MARAALFVRPAESGRAFRFLVAEAVAFADSIAGENRDGSFRFLDERRGVGGIVEE